MTDALSAARRGDRRAFDRAFGEHVPKLRGVLRRMVGVPADVDDLAQQALLQAFEHLDSFRGDANPGTWLCAIGARLAVDHLRRKRRWRERAQVVLAARCLQEDVGAEVGAAMAAPDFAYEVNEHIAYCFTCVGRTLEPEQQAALVLRDVLELTNAEAARALRMNQGAFRRRLTVARDTMQARYEGLCALVSKDGVCWQCAGLREAAPEGRRGPVPPDAIDWPTRLRIVREAALDRGRSQPMHDVFFALTDAQEEAELGDGDEVTGCGRPT